MNHRTILKIALLILLVLLISHPAPLLVVLGPPRAVETINPKMGLHTRLTDEVEEWKIKRTAEMVREMGAPWIVEYFPWGYYEPAPGQYHWEHPDLVVDHARQQGLTVIARLDFVPEWARPEETTFRYLDAAHYADYGEFVHAFVAHFRGRVSHIIIWNEPNLSFEWGYRQPDPAEYTEMLRVAYTRAKEANPEVMVLAGALAPTLAAEGSEWGLDDLIYLRGMYDAGASAYFDALAIHAYGWKFPADDPPAPNKINFRRAELLRQVMVEHGDAHKPCFITEAGWNDHPRWNKAVRPYQRIENTRRAYEIALYDWEWCAAVAMWAFRYPWDTHTYRDAFTFVTPDFRAKPIYLEMQRYARGESEE